jgi:hypothetical protein
MLQIVFFFFRGPTGAYQADNVGRVLLVADEEETLTGVGGPGKVAAGILSRLLGLDIVGECLGLEGLGAEEEELLAGN